MKTTDRRAFLEIGLRGLTALASMPLLGELSGCQQLPSRQTATSTSAPKPGPSSEKLADRITLIGGVPGNVIALTADDGVLLVDSGAADSARAVKASLAGAKVRTLFNTHHHADQ